MLLILECDEHCSWMKNCITILDIMFIKDAIITKFHHHCPPCYEEECQNYCGKGQMVLEVQGGTCRKKGIKKGDKLEY